MLELFVRNGFIHRWWPEVCLVCLLCRDEYTGANKLLFSSTNMVSTQFLLAQISRILFHSFSFSCSVVFRSFIPLHVHLVVVFSVLYQRTTSALGIYIYMPRSICLLCVCVCMLISFREHCFSLHLIIYNTNAHRTNSFVSLNGHILLSKYLLKYTFFFFGGYRIAMFHERWKRCVFSVCVFICINSE